MLLPATCTIDGRGQAEVENLVGDVGGAEEERDAGEIPAEALAQHLLIFGGGSVALVLKRDENVAIADADGGAVAVGEIEAAIGQADVIDDGVDFAGGQGGADIALDIGEIYFGLFDARADGRAGVQAHLAGIDGGKEIAADEIDEPERAEGKDHEAGEDGLAVVERPIGKD